MNEMETIQTIMKQVDAEVSEKDIDVYQEAAAIIRGGGLVAFPTETVYGLGANGLSEDSVRKIYEAKGRPSDNPLILHISARAQLDKLVREVPAYAQTLIDRFWPGPLTMVFLKSDLVPMQSTGGLDTVAVRMPKNKVALRLIEEAGVPIAAPSANVSGKPSPTRASHVAFDLSGKIDMIIDGGHAEYGLESTIVDVTGDVPCILRPGSITKKMIEDCVGTTQVDNAVPTDSATFKPKAPGMKYTHYAPKANVTIVRGSLDNMVAEINRLAKDSVANNIKTGIMATEQTKNRYECGMVLVVGDREEEKTIAANLFKMLRGFDHKEIENVYVEAVEENDVGLAIMNRLYKAAGYHIIDV